MKPDDESNWSENPKLNSTQINKQINKEIEIEICYNSNPFQSMTMIQFSPKSIVDILFLKKGM